MLIIYLIKYKKLWFYLKNDGFILNKIALICKRKSCDLKYFHYHNIIFGDSGIPVLRFSHIMRPSFSALPLLDYFLVLSISTAAVLAPLGRRSASAKRFFICFYSHLLSSCKFDVVRLVCVFFLIYHNFDLAFVWVGVSW